MSSTTAARAPSALSERVRDLRDHLIIIHCGLKDIEYGLRMSYQNREQALRSCLFVIRIIQAGKLEDVADIDPVIDGIDMLEREMGSARFSTTERANAGILARVVLAQAQALPV